LRPFANAAPASEATYLHRFNQYEARAWVGLAVVAHQLFDIEWELLPARDVGTYCFVGGTALVDVPAGSAASRTGITPIIRAATTRWHARSRRKRARGSRANGSTTSSPGSRPPRRSAAPRAPRATHRRARWRGAVAAPAARPQRPVPMRLDAEVEAVLRRRSGELRLRPAS
jgi:hypothetical protein